MTKRMVVASTNMPMEQLMRETGMRTNNMGKESKNGQMVQSTAAFTKKAKRMAMVLLLLLTVVSTKVTLFRMRSLDKENMSGQMENHTMANGRKIRCTDRVFKSGMMVRSMRDSSRTTKDRVVAPSLGEMAEFMMVSGLMASSMDRAFSLRWTKPSV